MSIAGNISDHQKTRFNEFIKQGTNMKQEVADLNEALKDLAKTLGEEMNIEPKLLMKAVNIAFKGSEQAEAERENNSTLEELLALCGLI